MSGVYIKGIEMPTDCAMLLKIFPDGRVGVPVHLNWMGTLVVNDAEAVPVPPHGRLIDVDKVLDELAHNLGIRSLDYLAPSERAIVSWFRDATTIIPAEEGET